MPLEKSEPKATVRLEALKVAASFFTGLARPDADEIVKMATTFETYVVGTASASTEKRKSRAHKSQAPSES